MRVRGERCAGCLGWTHAGDALARRGGCVFDEGSIGLGQIQVEILHCAPPSDFGGGTSEKETTGGDETRGDGRRRDERGRVEEGERRRGVPDGPRAAEEDVSPLRCCLVVVAAPASRSGATCRSSTPDDSLFTAASTAIAVKRPSTVFFRCCCCGLYLCSWLCGPTDGGRARADRDTRPRVSRVSLRPRPSTGGRSIGGRPSAVDCRVLLTGSASRSGGLLPPGLGTH